MQPIPATPTRLYGLLPGGLRARVNALQGRLLSSSFFKNVFVMLSGTILGQVFSVVAAPFLTRIYSPSEFGYLNVYTSTLSLLAVVASLRYEMAIPIAETEIEAADLLGVCSLSLLVMTSLIAVLAYTVPTGVLERLPWTSALGLLLQHAWLLPLGVACLGGYYILNFVATRAGAFKTIARTRITQGLAGPSSQIAMGLMGFGVPGLALGFVIGQSTGTALLFSRLVLAQREVFGQITWRGMAAAARRYVRFPLVSSWSALLEDACHSVTSILIASLFSPQIAGYMLLSDRVVGRPLLMLSTSLLQVFVGEAGHAIANDPAKLQRRFRQIVVQQFAITAVWIVIANVFAYFAFPFLFGPKWSAATVYLVALSGAYLFQSALHPVSHTLQLLQMQLTAAGLQAARLALIVTAITVPWALGWSAVQALLVYSGVQMVTCSTILAVMERAIRKVQVT